VSNFDAIYNASIVRFRPILMTGIAAIMGAMPIALGFGADGSSRMPLGLIVVGGMIFSQVITLFITRLYSFICRISRRSTLTNTSCCVKDLQARRRIKIRRNLCYRDQNF
jgi:HAE1 family hydrophobic/amphiphilic exporter-1